MKASQERSRARQRGSPLPSRDPISPDTPLRLAVAAELVFPDGGVSAAALRAEAARGRLVIERIGGKLYTTLAAMAEMRRLCRVPATEEDRTRGEMILTREQGGRAAQAAAARRLADRRERSRKILADLRRAEREEWD